MFDFDTAAALPEDKTFLALEHYEGFQSASKWRDHGYRGAVYDLTQHSDFDVEELQFDAWGLGLTILSIIKSSNPYPENIALDYTWRDAALQIALPFIHSDGSIVRLQEEEQQERLDLSPNLVEFFRFLAECRAPINRHSAAKKVSFRINQTAPDTFHPHEKGTGKTMLVILKGGATEILSLEGKQFTPTTPSIVVFDEDVLHRASTKHQSASSLRILLVPN